MGNEYNGVDLSGEDITKICKAIFKDVSGKTGEGLKYDGVHFSDHPDFRLREVIRSELERMFESAHIDGFVFMGENIPESLRNYNTGNFDLDGQSYYFVDIRSYAKIVLKKTIHTRDQAT